MPRFDLPLEQLHEYRTETAGPAGFDSWRQLRLDQARAQACPA
jgi:cephalosporin-C deacetylase-like acetyl esterase